MTEAKKRGRPPKDSPQEQKKREQKERVVENLEEGISTTLASAARKAGVPPRTVYEWKKSDMDFTNRLSTAFEVVADRFEEELSNMTGKSGVTSRIFMLKGLRPDKYQEGSTIQIITPETKSLLGELYKLGKKDSEKGKELEGKWKELPEESSSNVEEEVFGNSTSG